MKNSLIHILTLFLCILAFLCIFYNSTINTYKFKSSVEVYPIDVNPIEVYPIEAYLIGKGVVEVSGCHPGYPPKQQLFHCSLLGSKKTIISLLITFLPK